MVWSCSTSASAAQAHLATPGLQLCKGLRAKGRPRAEAGQDRHLQEGVVRQVQIVCRLQGRLLRVRLWHLPAPHCLSGAGCACAAGCASAAGRAPPYLPLASLPAPRWPSGSSTCRCQVAAMPFACLYHAAAMSTAHSAGSSVSPPRASPCNAPSAVSPTLAPAAVGAGSTLRQEAAARDL